MVSLKAFLKDCIQFSYSVPEIAERYVDWVRARALPYLLLALWFPLDIPFTLLSTSGDSMIVPNRDRGIHLFRPAFCLRRSKHLELTAQRAVGTSSKMQYRGHRLSAGRAGGCDSTPESDSTKSQVHNVRAERFLGSSETFLLGC